MNHKNLTVGLSAGSRLSHELPGGLTMVVTGWTVVAGRDRICDARPLAFERWLECKSIPPALRHPGNNHSCRPPGNSVAQPATGGQANVRSYVHVIHIVPNLPQTPTLRPFENIVSLEVKMECLVWALTIHTLHQWKLPSNPPARRKGVNVAHVVCYANILRRNSYFPGFIDSAGTNRFSSSLSHCHSPTGLSPVAQPTSLYRSIG